MTIPLKKIKDRWMNEPEFKEGYDLLEDKFSNKHSKKSSKISISEKIKILE